MYAGLVAGQVPVHRRQPETAAIGRGRRPRRTRCGWRTGARCPRRGRHPDARSARTSRLALRVELGERREPDPLRPRPARRDRSPPSAPPPCPAHGVEPGRPGRRLSRSVTQQLTAHSVSGTRRQGQRQLAARRRRSGRHAVTRDRARPSARERGERAVGNFIAMRSRVSSAPVPASIVARSSSPGLWPIDHHRRTSSSGSSCMRPSSSPPLAP